MFEVRANQETIVSIPNISRICCPPSVGDCTSEKEGTDRDHSMACFVIGLRLGHCLVEVA